MGTWEIELTFAYRLQVFGGVVAIEEQHLRVRAPSSASVLAAYTLFAQVATVGGNTPWGRKTLRDAGSPFLTDGLVRVDPTRERLGTGGRSVHRTAGSLHTPQLRPGTALSVYV